MAGCGVALQTFSCPVNSCSYPLAESLALAVVVVFVHPAYRKRLDSLRQVQLLIHPVLSQVPQMYHPCAMPARESRRANILTGSQCFPVWLRLLTHRRDLCCCGDHVAVVRGHTPQSFLAAGSRATLQFVDQVISVWLALLASSHMGRVVSRMPRRWKMTTRWVRHRCVLHNPSWLFCSIFVVWFQIWSLLHIWFVRRARGIQYRFRSRLRIRGSRWWFSVGIWHRWQWCVPNGFIPLFSSSLWWSARRCRGLPRRPFHVCNSFCRPAPLLRQSPDRSRAENHIFAPNDVFVGVGVPAQPTSVHKLCLAFLQMCSRPSCQNQLSRR